MTDDDAPDERPTDDELRRLAALKAAPPIVPLRAWVVATAQVPAQGLAETRQASAQERADIAAALSLTALDALEAVYRIRSLPGGGWRLSGSILADTVQPCVVTLEPLAQRITDTFDVEFWRGRGEDLGGEDKSVLEGADVETLQSDEIDVGRIVFEALSAGIDPYPRKPGVDFDWSDPKAAEPQKDNPFSVLAKLKGGT